MTIKFRKPTKLGEACVSWLNVEGRALECTAATCLYFRRNVFWLISFRLDAAWFVSVGVSVSSFRRSKAVAETSTLVVVAESMPS